MNTPPSRRQVLFVLSLVVVGFPLVQSLFVPALPLVQPDFDATTSTTAATFTVSFVAAAVATPVLGSIADNHGPRRTLLATLSVFLAGSLLAFAAPSITALLVARVMQGAGGAVLPLCFAVLRQRFSTSEAARGVAYLSGVLGLGSAFGLVASGALIHVGSYRLLFVVSVLQAAAGMVVAGLWLPHDRPTARVPLDWFGATLLAAGTGSLLLAVTQVTEWGVGSTPFLVVLGTSALLLAGWVRWEHRARRPLLPVLLLHDSLLARANLASLFTAPALVGFFILVPQLAQAPETTGYGFGATALGSGVLLLPMTVTMLGAGVLCGRLVLTHPPRGWSWPGACPPCWGALFCPGLTRSSRRWPCSASCSASGSGWSTAGWRQ